MRELWELEVGGSNPPSPTGIMTTGDQEPTDFHLGLDENGLGPRLGPMIVTAVMARTTKAGAKVVGRKARGKLATRLGDSKGLVAHGKIGLAEAWTRVLVAHGAGKNREADSPQQLLQAVSLDDQQQLRSPCPAGVEAQCWSYNPLTFDDGFTTRRLLDTLSKDLDKLARRGVHIVAVRSIILCAKRLNLAAAAGENRFVADLHAMERLILALRAQAGRDVDAVCGKVGGFKSYGKAFGPLGGRLHTVLEEERARSAYRFPGVGDIAFVRNVDDTNLLVGLASLVGKYLRELLMGNIVHRYRETDATLPRASGYHDPVTARFVLETATIRRQQEIPDICFER